MKKLSVFGQLMKCNAGIAYDEAILVLAMVSSAASFGAVTIPWDKLLKDGSERVVEQLSSIENANQQFYDRYRLWPYETTNGDEHKNAAVLLSQKAMKFPYNTMRSFSPVLEEGDYSLGSDNQSLRHNFGDGGEITQRVVNDSKGSYLEVTFQNMPLERARKVDELVDGSYDPMNGRVWLRGGESEGKLGKAVTMVYRANRV